MKGRHKAQILAAALWLILGSVAHARQTTNNRQVEGKVVDSQGLAISGARITVTEQQGGFRKTAVSTADQFRVDGLPAAAYDVLVEADGFATQTVTADLRNQPSASLEVRLEPATLAQEIIVSATRTEQRLGDIPASATVISADEIKASPAVVADDVLRQAPTFSLFRRTSSLAAHPTAQGVSLRGIGPSGVSRTLVLLDNVPFNDPFGGWVYWTRVPLISTDRIEMVDGANSSVYGNYAMGGVINVMTTRPQRRTIVLKPQYGGRRNPNLGKSGSDVWDGLGSLDFFASDVWKNFGAAVEGGVFNTNGYPTIPSRDLNGAVLRGPIDQKATVNYQNLNLKLDYTPTSRLNVFARGGYFSEDRHNAKICRPTSCDETNDTLWKFVSGGVRATLPDQSDLQARVFANWERFHSSFLAVGVVAGQGPRSLGRLTLRQTVPTKDAGYMVQWSKALPGNQYFTVGTDFRWVDGDSVEDAFDATLGTTRTVSRVAGGTQRSFGVFMQDIISVTSRFQVTLSARLDHWRNYNAHNLETTVATGAPTANNRPSLADKDNTVGSPRGAARYHFNDKVSVWGAASWGFRAPTLNELYRSFQVGAVRTTANENLGAERLMGGEAGVNVSPVRNFTWRTTWFHDRFKSPVSNVTIGTNLRQRQNLGRTRIYGIQSDVEYRMKTYWRFSSAYVYDQATVREFPADRTLQGKFLAQVPRHRGSVQLSYSNPKYLFAAVSAQFMSRQFEDDQNLLRLPGFGTMDFNVGRSITENFEAFFGVQNLLDRTFYVQRNPTTIGAPRLITGGFRITFRGQ
ncbi:MAG: TonB-dependent receptor [Acidobacteria bacterium]|nr:TonB-dependent receptor [Acidobacteriota bacterium]